MGVRILRMVALAAGVLAALLLPALAQGAKPGDLDPSFGTGGKVITDFGGDVEGEILAEAIDSRGRIVAAGNSQRPTGRHSHLRLARYRSDGSLDPSFGAGGLVTADLGGLEYASSIAIDARGRILAAGALRRDFALARYTPDGTPDASFGTGGLVTTDFGGREYASSIAIDARGRILAAGAFGHDFALARYTPDGGLDPSFSGDGKEITVLSPRVKGVRTRSAAIDSRNRIYVAGNGTTRSGHGDFVIVRYRPNGGISRSYGRHGHVITDFGRNDSLESIAIDSHGRVVAAGSTGGRVALARYRRDGSLSRSFGGDGTVTTRFGHGHGSNDHADDVAIDSRGRIVAVGYRGRTFGDEPGDSVYTFAGVRYRPDGRLDRSFGGDGKVTTRFGSDFDSAAFAVAIDARDRIVAAGYRSPRYPLLGGDYALARYIGYAHD